MPRSNIRFHIDQCLITDFFKPRAKTPIMAFIEPSPIPETNYDINDEWALFDEAMAEMHPNQGNCNELEGEDQSNNSQFIPDLVPSYEQLSSNQRIDPQFPKNSNHTKIAVATNAGDRRLKKMLTWNLDSKEYQAWKDKDWATNTLQRAQLGDEIVRESIDVFCSICRVVEKKRKKNKKRILIGALYYVLKRHEQPPMDFVAKVLQVSKSQTVQAVKAFRVLARELPEELGWVFDVERGQTSLFRYASEAGLNRQDVKKITQHIKENNLDGSNNTIIRTLIQRCLLGRL